MFGKGAKRSHPDKLAKRKLAAEHPRITPLVASPPASASCASYEPPRENQGQTGSCTAHSGSACMYTAVASIAAITKASSPLPFVPSPRELYAATRAIERAAATAPGAPLPLLTDSGAEPADVMSALAQFGVCPIQGQPTDVTTANVNDEPDVDQLEAAATYLITGAYGINVDSSASATCAAAIAAGYPIYVAFYCDTGFENWHPGDASYGATNQRDPNGGGHAVFIDAYTTNPDGSRTWRLVNSWGTSWGDNGTILVSDAFLQACWELWVADVTVSTTKGAT